MNWKAAFAMRRPRELFPFGNHFQLFFILNGKRAHRLCGHKSLLISFSPALPGPALAGGMGDTLRFIYQIYLSAGWLHLSNQTLLSGLFIAWLPIVIVSYMTEEGGKHWIQAEDELFFSCVCLSTLAHTVGNVILVLQSISRPQGALRMNRSSVSQLSLLVNTWVVRVSLYLRLSPTCVSCGFLFPQLPVDRPWHRITLVFGATVANATRSLNAVHPKINDCDCFQCAFH